METQRTRQELMEAITQMDGNLSTFVENMVREENSTWFAKKAIESIMFRIHQANEEAVDNLKNNIECYTIYITPERIACFEARTKTQLENMLASSEKTMRVISEIEGQFEGKCKV